MSTEKQPPMPDAWKPFTTIPGEHLQLAAMPPARKLVGKLAQVMAAVERIAKRGHNDHFHYDFATESDITAAIRGELAARQVMLIPDVKEITWRDIQTKNGVQSVACVKVRFTFHDGETGETIAFLMAGEGQDSGDKSVPKALTSATKFALLKCFLIPTGDDPERTEKSPARVNRKLTPASPEVVVDARTGAEVSVKARPPAPQGYRYIDQYHVDSGGWHHLTFLRADASGGAFIYKTRMERTGDTARQAYQDGIPVRCEGRPNAKTKGEWILDKIHVWKPGGETSDGDVTVHLASEIL